MNHFVIYNNIIEHAKNSNRKKSRKSSPEFIYYEKHHIVPRCLDGTDDKENLVFLTGREHFICHKLLTYIYPNNRKIICAFHKMAFCKRKEYEASSRDYEYARILIKSVPINDETRIKIGKRTLGKTYEELYGVNASEQREKRSKSLTGKKHSLQRIENNRKAQLGKIPWNKGLTKNDERVKKYIEKTRIKHPFKTFILITPLNEKILFLGKKELENYIKEINNNKYRGTKIGIDELITKKECKNFKLKIEKYEKFN
jgi:hypothetical protein